MRDLLFHLQRDSRTPLQTQLRELLVSAILQGQIPVGRPLPSRRKLAETLDVARNTAALAYQDLVADGFLVAQERRGYFINSEILRGRAPAVAVARAQAATPDWGPRLKLRPTSQRNIVKPRDWQSYRYPFIYGQIDPTLFPLSEWRECSRQALSVEAVNDAARQHRVSPPAPRLAGRDSTVGIEDPGYADARNIFLLQTEKLRALGVDD